MRSPLSCNERRTLVLSIVIVLSFAMVSLTTHANVVSASVAFLVQACAAIVAGIATVLSIDLIAECDAPMRGAFAPVRSQHRSPQLSRVHAPAASRPVFPRAPHRRSESSS